jgi:hypothetical protein
LSDFSSENWSAHVSLCQEFKDEDELSLRKAQPFIPKLELLNLPVMDDPDYDYQPSTSNKETLKDIMGDVRNRTTQQANNPEFNHDIISQNNASHQ